MNISIEDEDTVAAMLAVPGIALLENACLFLDFDGTLVEIAADPGAVIVATRLPDLLGRLSARLAGRLGIISGRPISELQQYLGQTSLMMAGSHGDEILWPDGTCSCSPPPRDLSPVIEAVDSLQQRCPGIVIERKPFGVAIHFRGAPQAEAACQRLATALARSHGLVLQAGKMVFELRVGGMDKGDALRALMGSAGMQDSRPIFIGDDDTDERAFVVAAELGGAGILVGPARPTAARYRLDNVAATLAWLDAACSDRR